MRVLALLSALFLTVSLLEAQAPAPAKPGAASSTPASSSPASSGAAKPGPGKADPAKASTPAVVPGQVVSAKPDPWVDFRFLVGAWEAKTTGGVAQVQVIANYSFRLELHDHILARHTTKGHCNSVDDFDCRHSDLLYIYPADNGQGFLAIYFDNEGHVIHYTVSAPKPGTVLLISDAAQPGPQYRLTYELLEGAMTGKFEVKMPGQGDFSSYLEWSSQHP
jgi:hypothetical protein